MIGFMKILGLFFVVLLMHSGTALASCRNPVNESLSDDVGLKTYALKQKASQGQILLMPPTGGENFTDRRLAQKLCQHGFKVQILDYSQPDGLTLDLGVHDRTINLVLSTVDLFMRGHQEPTVIIGASLGGLYASLIYSLGQKADTAFPSFAQVKGLITTVAGGSLAEVLATSQLEPVIAQRSLRMRSGRYANLADYQHQLSEAVTLDPLALAEKSSNVLAYVATNDKVVITKAQYQLAHAHGAEIRIIHLLNHQFSVLSTYYTQANEFASFARKVLE